MTPEKTAPGRLETVQRFVNTVDLERGEEALSTPQTLVDWLTAAGLLAPGASADPDDLSRALAVREGLRALAGAHNGSRVDPDALAALERAATEAPLRASFTGSEPELAPVGPGVSAALAHVLAAVATAVADGTWARFKACADPGCRWAFYDTSRNHSGRWCSMATCGNQQKARSYRERTRAAG